MTLTAAIAGKSSTWELRRYCQTRKGAMLAERMLFEPDWLQVADYLDPYAGRFIADRNGKIRNKLPSRAKIINSRPGRALRTMDAGFMGGMTSKAQAWFRLTVGDPTLGKQADVKAWLDDTTQEIRDQMARSNFYTVLPQLYHARHLFGVALMGIEDDDHEVVRFYSRDIGTYAIAIDYRGRVDSVWWKFEMRAAQIADKWGLDECPPRISQAIKDGKPDTKFMVESLLEPNPDAKAGMGGAAVRPYRQIMWIDGADADSFGCLGTAGFYELPVLGTRWAPGTSNTYSTSPALEALGDIRQLQYLEGEKLRLVDLTGKPPTMLPEYLRNKGVGLNPGEKVYVTPAQTQLRAEPIYVPLPAAIQQEREEIAEVSNRIDSAFFADLFRLLDSLPDQQRTAYEISERKAEKIAQLGPALESLTDEVLSPAIMRVYAIMLRRGRIPPLPDALNGATVQIEYTSMLAQAQKAGGTSSLERVFGFAASLMQITGGQRPDILDNFDFDESIEIVADQQGAPARMLVDPDAREQARQQRAQQQQMAQAAQMAPAIKQGADALHTAATTAPVDNNMAAAMAQQMALPA